MLPKTPNFCIKDTAQLFLLRRKQGLQKVLQLRIRSAFLFRRNLLTAVVNCSGGLLGCPEGDPVSHAFEFITLFAVGILQFGFDFMHASAAGKLVNFAGCATAALVFGLMEGTGRAERTLRWIARKLGFSEDRAGAAVRQVGGRLEALAKDRQLLFRVALWAAMNWLLDAAALWVFLRAFGKGLDFDALIIAFGLANVFAVVPITPGGLGLIEGIYIPTLVGFGLSRAQATVGVLTYRVAQFWLPIFVGGVLYATLRMGPFSIKRRGKLKRLRDLAAETETNPESILDFAARFDRESPRLRRAGDPTAQNGVDRPR